VGRSRPGRQCEAGVIGRQGACRGFCRAGRAHAKPTWAFPRVTIQGGFRCARLYSNGTAPNPIRRTGPKFGGTSSALPRWKMSWQVHQLREHHREAITSRPLLLQAIGRQTSHAGRTTVTVTSSHGEHRRAREALTRIAGFFSELRKTAEQLTPLERWYRILSEALKKFRRGRILVPPRQLQPAGAASYS
jgi:transposase-like protein